jgi:outer membrane receptor protein involved in Fe transport
MALGAAAVSPPALAEEVFVEEVVVTGSRIQRSNLVTSSPVQQLDAEDISLTGVTRLEDALAALPQISLDQSSGQAIESIGTATLELRGLSSSRTLVLMNGRRLPVNSPNDTESGADINFIPRALVERVEVMTGGASSTYGADAVAGVVNFIMIDDFEGVKFDYQYSGYRHKNDGNLVADAAQEANFDYATGTATDGDTHDLSLIIGGNLEDGRGNITGYATYRDIEGIIQADRDYSACAVRSGLTCLGSGTNVPGSFYFDNDDFNALYHVAGTDFADGLGSPLYNFAPPSYLQRPDERWNLGMFGHYALTDNIEAYAEFMFMDTRSITQFGPAGIFFNTLDFNCGNPNLSAQQTALVGCTDPVGNPDQVVSTIFGRRNDEGGARFGDLRHSTFRTLFGVRGDINDNWSYDASFQYSEVDMRNRNGNYVNIFKADNALDVNPDGTCINTDGGNCVPWNIFQTGGVTDEAVGYINQQYFERGTTDQLVLQGFVSGDVDDWALPTADNGLSVVLGLEYREEGLVYQPDDSALAGQVGGLTAALVPIDGEYDVTEFFAEATLPLVEGAAWAQSLDLDLGYRFSSYKPSDEDTHTYKVALGWQIVNDFKLRGSYQRAVRAPNVVDQFQPQQGSLFAMDEDPCGGVVGGTSARGYTFDQCARSGVTQAIWNAGGPTDSPAAQYNQLIGGTTELVPEESDTYIGGFVWTPGFIEGLTVSLDYYDIKVTDAIEDIEPETTLLQCIENNQFCDRVNRGQNDSLWLGQAGPTNGINALTQNIGFFQTKAIDLELTWSVGIGDAGTLFFNNVYGHVVEWKKQEFPGSEVLSCEGVYGGSCELPLPENANRFSVAWSTPWNLLFNLNWRFLDGVAQTQTSSPIDIDSQNYVDIAANWQATEKITLRVGINNLLDEEPPFVPQGVTARENGNTYPGIYDPLGSYWFASFTVGL